MYKNAQEPSTRTAADIVIPYITDAIIASASYANGFSLVAMLGSVVSADWMSRLVTDMVPDQAKKNYLDPILDYALEFCNCVYETTNQIISINHEL